MHTLFYFSFILSNDDRSLYKTDTDILLNDKNDKVKSRVQQIQAILRKKKLTEDRQEKKKIENLQVVHPKQANVTLSQFLLCRIAVTEKICFTFSNPKTNDSCVAQ